MTLGVKLGLLEARGPVPVDSIWKCRGRRLSSPVGKAQQAVARGCVHVC